MLSTPPVGITGELLLDYSLGVHLAEKVANLHLSSNEAWKGLLDCRLLSGGIIRKHVAEVPPIITPPLDL